MIGRVVELSTAVRTELPLVKHTHE
jgi:hypothetical protein